MTQTKQAETTAHQQEMKGHKTRLDLIEERLEQLEERAGINFKNVRCTCAYCLKHPWVKPTYT